MAGAPTVDELLALARLLAGPDPAAAEIEAAASKLSWVRSVSTTFGGESGVDYAELELEDGALSRDDLAARLGEPAPVPRLHAGDPRSVAFRLDEPGLPFTCALIAALDEDGGVQTLTLRRDERLD